MKKLLLILLCLPMIGFGQSLIETQDWISEKISIYGTFTEETVEFGFIKRITNVFFDDNKKHIIITNSTRYYESNIVLGAKYTIPINFIKNVSLSKNYGDGYVYLKITTFSNNKICMSTVSSFDSALTILNFENSTECDPSLNKCKIKMSNDVLGKNLDDRFNKAFEKLIELYGGLKNETF